MRRALAATIAASFVLALFVASPGIADNDLLSNKYSPTEVEVICYEADGETEAGRVVYGGPLKLWPPNHKYQAITITATDADAADSVKLQSSGKHEEYDEEGKELTGAGSTENDVNPAAASNGFNDDNKATTGHSLRSERTGGGDGRIYTLDWQATFRDDNGDDETVVCGSADLDPSDGVTPTPADAFQVTVPHDQRGGAGWKK